VYQIKGINTALITPFQKASKNNARPAVDYASLEALIDFQLAAGVEGFVVCGTTAEASTLEDRERFELLSFVKAKAQGKAGVCFGSGSNCTWKTVETIAEAKATGAEAALVVTPFYNKPTQSGVRSHFEYIAERSELPIIIYDIFSRTSVDISIETMAALAQHENIIGVKEAPSNGSKLAEISKLISPSFQLLAGDDFLFFLSLCSGAVGAISAAANILPSELKEIMALFQSGKIEESRKAHEVLTPALEALYLETNPAPLKKALALKGVISAESVRLPLVEVSEETERALQQYF